MIQELKTIITYPILHHIICQDHYFQHYKIKARQLDSSYTGKFRLVPIIKVSHIFKTLQNLYISTEYISPAAVSK